MRLICTNLDCEHDCPDYEAAGPYVAPECPKCWSPMEEFIPPTPRFLGATLRNAVEGGGFEPAMTADLYWDAVAMERDEARRAREGVALPVPNLRIRQAGG